jgi:lipoprotein-anchoring transpeptidase ErfK/SrfK
MITARTLRRLGGAALFLGVFGLSGAVPAHAQGLAYSQTNPSAPVYPYTAADEQQQPSPALQRQVVSYTGGEAAGTIIVDAAHTFLYLTLGNGRALRYGIGVGREGFEWSGVETIVRKTEWPDWTPPAAMIARQPYLPRWIGGGPGNPLGARALYLGNTDYRIHGTNDPSSIGKHMSSGCIRLLNADIVDLYDRVGIGTKVVVLPDTDSQRISAAQTDVNLPSTAAAPRAVAPRHRQAAHSKTPLAHTASREAATFAGVY